MDFESCLLAITRCARSQNAVKILNLLERFQQCPLLLPCMNPSSAWDHTQTLCHACLASFLLGKIVRLSMGYMLITNKFMWFQINLINQCDMPL